MFRDGSEALSSSMNKDIDIELKLFTMSAKEVKRQVVTREHLSTFDLLRLHSLCSSRKAVRP